MHSCVRITQMPLWEKNPQRETAIFCVEFTEGVVLFTESGNITGTVAVVFLRGKRQTVFTEENVALVAVAKLYHKPWHSEHLDLKMPLLPGHLAAGVYGVGSGQDQLGYGTSAESDPADPPDLRSSQFLCG